MTYETDYTGTAPVTDMPDDYPPVRGTPILKECHPGCGKYVPGNPGYHGHEDEDDL